MSLGWIALIVFGSIYLIIIMIVSILAYKYQKTHTPYKKVRDEYRNEWNLLKKKSELENLLKPIEVDLELPEGEQIFFIDDEAQTIIDKLSKKEIRKSGIKSIDRIDAYYEMEDFTSFKENYKIEKNDKRKIAYDGIIFLTNRRIMFENKGEYKQLHIDKIKSIGVSIVTFQKINYKGYIIRTSDEIYRIISKKPKMIMVLEKILEMRN
ncbi:hypothetical protein [Mesoplasma photuris]|uniref:hypothetical protein n=1 Tax=Mesoplasma photuris TaxID=217731 RepID=UPI0004E24FEC|nr:hypothetical protein [Mesoplasma photuris]